MGSYCRERTFLPNAPYAPGVTGVRLSTSELHKVNSGRLGELGGTLKKVLAECVAENLLVSRQSAASTSRDSGTVFYLNRTLCAHYDLPLQTGGWQDVDADKLIEWMERGRIPRQASVLGGQLNVVAALRLPTRPGSAPDLGNAFRASESSAAVSCRLWLRC